MNPQFSALDGSERLSLAILELSPVVESKPNSSFRYLFTSPLFSLRNCSNDFESSSKSPSLYNVYRLALG